MNTQNLLRTLKNAKNAALIVGAGISVNNGIPLGYDLPMRFGNQHDRLMKATDLFEKWEKAYYTKDWKLEAEFVEEFVKVFQLNSNLQNTFLSWLMDVPSMKGDSSDDHAIFVIAWFCRVFRHLITTNWDFLLEWQADAIYDQAYSGDPFEVIEFTLGNGAICEIEANRLFFLEPLAGDDFFWSPRWDITSHPKDLQDIKRWSRPLWKIHGSPFFLACPQCGSTRRWKREGPLQLNNPCQSHPDQQLVPEITFWGQRIDMAYPQVWKTIKDRLKRCDMIVASGFSGSGSDIYIRQVIENHANSWIVNPSQGSWNTKKINYVEAYASDLAQGLLDYFLAK